MSASASCSPSSTRSTQAAGRPTPRASPSGSRPNTRCSWAIQCCIDIAGRLAADLPGPPPESYADYFDALGGPDALDPELAERLKQAVGLRNILVHDYLRIDEDIVWGALGHLDDLRAFAAFVVARLDAASA